MLKWFQRDKNDPKAAAVPVAEQAGVPAEPEHVGAAGRVTPADTPAATDRVVEAAEAVVASSSAPAVEAPIAARAEVDSPPRSEPGASAEPVPWWRYEGVWRKPKAPAPVVEAPSAPVVEVPTMPLAEPPFARVAEVPVRPMAEAPARPEPVPEPVTELAPEPVSDPIAFDREPAFTPVVEAPVGRELTPVLPAAVPAVDPEEPVPTLFASEEPAPEPAKPRSLRERLAATARALTASVGSLFKRNPKLDEDLLEELETALIQADVGVTASTELVAKLGVRMRKREFADAQALLAALRTDLRALVVNHARPLHIPSAPRPFVILTVGVNGAGKTTTIGKLAMRYKQAGHSVMLAAGDTFRAAAVEQLKTWGDRNQVTVIAQGSGADSASVIFDALQAAKSRGIDVLIADTAGRLHTQGHLMQELAKVKRVLGKIDPTAPHETLLVIDGGTGQNALVQAKQFHQAVGLTGIVVTKLDGTAKGGMVFALCRELGLPIRFIGVGEKREDLREFVAEDFVDALLPRELGS